MTLEPYDAQELDRLVLRVLDITAIIRRMSVTARTAPDMAVGLHGKKARQWIGQLEQWAAESSARLDVALMLQKGGAGGAKKRPKTWTKYAQSEVADRPCAGLRQSRFRGEFADGESNEMFGRDKARDPTLPTAQSLSAAVSSPSNRVLPRRDFLLETPCRPRRRTKLRQLGRPSEN